MALRDQILNDYQLWDNRESVTVRVPVSNGSYTDYALGNCKRRVLTTKELAASAGRYTGSDLVWLIPKTIADAAGLGNIKPHDRVIDFDDNSYTVLEAAEQTLRTIWRLVTRNMRIAAGLHDAVSLQHPTITQTSAGGRSVSWTTISAAVVCRVQPRQTEVFDDRGVRSTTTVYDVYFEEDIAATNAAGDFARLLFGSKTLQIVNYKQADRIDVLPVAECREVP